MTYIIKKARKAKRGNGAYKSVGKPDGTAPRLGGKPAEPKAQSVARRDSALCAVQPSLQESVAKVSSVELIEQEPATQQTGSERSIITIEFYPEIHPSETEYSYEHPLFVFGDRVTLKNEYPQREYVVVGMELIESKTQSRRLLFQPYWKYKVSNGEVSYWKDESALIGYGKQQSTPTCLTCPHFNDYHEDNGRGWCHCFNNQSRTDHKMTGDCILNGSLDTPENATLTEVIELDRDGYSIEADSSSTFQVGSIVKIIDEEEHYSEWGVFEVVKVALNQEHFSDHKSYLNTDKWYYLLISYQQGDRAIWVGDSEICAADMSHHICTEEIF